MISYTYLLRFKPTGMLYYGCKYSKDANPKDLWVKYFSSSIKIKELILEYGKDSFEFEVRKTFDSPEKALRWERKIFTWILKKNLRDKFLNLNFAPAPLHMGKLNLDSIEKMRQTKLSGYASGKYVAWNKGHSWTEEQKMRMRGSKNPMYGKIGDKNPFFGKHHTEKTKQVMRSVKLGKFHGPMCDEVKRNISRARSGKRWYKNILTNDCVCCYAGNEPKGYVPGMIKKNKPLAPHIKNPEILKKLRLPQPIVVCPYCAKSGGKLPMLRYHFDNCKYKK